MLKAREFWEWSCVTGRGKDNMEEDLRELWSKQVRGRDKDEWRQIVSLRFKGLSE